MKRFRNILLLALLLCGSPLRHALAAPRPSWADLIPDFITPSYHESFDEAFYWGATNAQVVLDKYTLNESWSGYALQRSGAAVTPFYVPGVDSTGHTNINCSQGSVRFWLKPDWSSLTQTNGKGPGAVATLLELDVIGKNQSANVWSLQVNADGTLLSLVSQSDGNPVLLLQTEISWAVQQSQMIALDYNPKATTLYLNGLLAAQGAGTTPVPPQNTALFVGSSLAGKSVAGGDFDELSCFGAPTRWRFPQTMTPMEISFYYGALSEMAALGPISAEEIAAREQRIADMKAKSLSSKSALSLDGGGMESMAMRGTFGGFAGDCVTNVQVYLTNVWAGFETNNTMTVTFDVVGGTNSVIYDVFSKVDLTLPQWLWVTNTPTCSTVVLPNQPITQSFYMIRDGQLDSDGDGIPDWKDANPFDPNILILSVFIDSPANNSVISQ